MSMPLERALTPLALEMMMGRLASAAGGLESGELPADARDGAKRLVTPAAALPASEVRKNLRRDQRLMGPPPDRGGQYTGNWGRCVGSGEEQAAGGAGLAGGIVVGPPLLPGLGAVGERFADDEAKGAVDPAAGFGVKSIVIEKIQEIGNGGETLLVG